MAFNRSAPQNSAQESKNVSRRQTLLIDQDDFSSPITTRTTTIEKV
jgi:hypothetical protein